MWWMWLACAEPSWELAEAGEWWGADLHVHTSIGSNDSTDSLPADIATVAAERGLSLVMLTDHSNSAGSMDCATGDVEDCPNQGPEFPAQDAASAASTEEVALVVGVELSPVHALSSTTEPTGHTGCWPATPTAFAGLTDAFTDRPVGTVPGGDGVHWCQEVGGLAVVNHPYAPAGWIEYDWTSMDYDGLEVLNGVFDLGDAASVEGWLCDLAQGRRVIGVGGSDTHHIDAPEPPTPLEQALGWPTTHVFADSGDAASLLTALAGGRIVVAEPGTQLSLRARALGGPTAVGPGASLQAAGAVEVRITAEASAEDLVVQLLTATDCVDDRASDGTFALTMEVLWEERLGPVEQVVQLDTHPAFVLARVWPEDVDEGGFFSGVAVTAPIWLEP